MATSGSIQNTVTYTAGSALSRVTNTYTVTLSWSRTSVSTVSNSSTLAWTLTLNLKDAYGASNTGSSSKPYTVVFNGTTFSGNADVGIKRGETKTLATGSVTIPHNADGSKTFDYSFSQQVQTQTAAASGSGALDAINRVPSILTAPNFTDEDNPTITYSNPAGESMEALEACIANSTGKAIYVQYRDISKTGSSYTFNLTIDERNTLRAAANGSLLAVRFYIRYTINGKQDWVSVDRTMSLDDIVPTLNPTVEDTDAKIIALTGDKTKIILGYSDVAYNIGVTAPTGTSIITQLIRCGAQSKDTNTGTFTDVATNVFEFSATDSRGNTGTETIEMDVIPYIPVSCRQTVRLNKDGTISLTVQGNYFNESFGAVNNELFVEHRTRKAGDEEWSDWTSIHILIDDISGGTYTLYADGGDEYFDPSGTYEFQTRAYDKLITAEFAAESDVSSITLKPVFDWGKYDFNFNVPLTIEGDPLADYVIETGEAIMDLNGTNGTWYWSKWRSGKAECYGCRNYGNMAVSTAWGGLYRSGAFTQSFPSGLFADTPEVINISFRGGSNVGGWIANHENSAPSDSETGSFIVVRPASATMSQVYLSFHVIGRWK